MRWLLCDYGNVLSLDQPEEDRRALADEAGLGEDAFALAYWAGRDPYDKGDVTAGEFWARVCGQPVDPGRLARLVELDVRSWTHPRTATLEAVARAAGRGLATALLSNAPVEIARAADGLSWLQGFAPRLFSCDLGEVKPAKAVFAWALERLGARPDEVVFVDDRPANVEGARRVGIDGIVFRDPAQLDAVGAPPGQS